MENTKPSFVHPESEMVVSTVRFNGIQISVYEAHGIPSEIKGWANNPRTEMIVNRWRILNGYTPDVPPPDDDEMLDLMLQDDETNRGRKAFDIRTLGDDVKLDGVRDRIIVDWNGLLLDGNRRKFALMWALSHRTTADASVRELLSRIPMYVLMPDATQSEKEAILSHENYADSLKLKWPEIVTNGRLYDTYMELWAQSPQSTELEIRQLVRDKYPRFSVTEISYLIQTWKLVNEFRVDYDDDLREDELDSIIDSRFQQFRQARDTFTSSGLIAEPTFKDLLFRGIRNGLFPSFAAVRALGDIHASPAAIEIFNQGEGMHGGQVSANFERARDEARRARANSSQPVESRIADFIEFLNDLTSVQMVELPTALRQELEETLLRVITQSDARSSIESQDA